MRTYNHHKSYFKLDEAKLLIADVPKAGSQSVRKMVLEHLGLPMDHIWKMGHLKVDDARPYIRQGYRGYAVVRDPYTRVVSGYFNKIVQNANKILPQADDFIKSVGGRENATFRRFVDFIGGMKCANLDPHWAPQICIVKDPAPLTILKIEGDLSPLEDALGVEMSSYRSGGNHKFMEKVDAEFCGDTPPTGFSNHRIDHGGTMPKWESFYDDELRARVRSVYNEDFNNFGYDK